MSDSSTVHRKHHRRYDIGPSYIPLIQGVIATIPLALVFGWFTYEAYRISSQDCSVDNEENGGCSHLLALGDMIVICTVVSFFWALVLSYLMYYVPKRHALVHKYLTEGKRTIGDLFYKPRKGLGSCGSLSSYGSIVYPHPNRDFPIMLRRQVRVYDKFTRERSVLLYLPDQPLSAQPKLDLEIDNEVTELNAGRLEYITIFALIWYTFSIACSTYIRWVLSDIESGVEDGIYWIPNYGQVADLLIFSILTLMVVPGVSFTASYIAWRRHEDWFTNQHKILQEGDPVNPSTCCYYELDNDDDGEGEYSGPRVGAHNKFRRMVDDR